jgi:hypothetical protein
MNRVLFTDIEVGEEKYRIHKLTARDGSWVLNTLLRKIMPGVNTREEFDAVQALLLKNCYRYIAEGPEPLVIMNANDRWAFKDLEYDLMAVTKLTAEALAFNTKDFFENDGMNVLTSAFRAMLPSTQETSTGE